LKYPNFEKDLERTIFLQRVAFEMVKLQNDSGLSLDNFAQQIELPKSHISRLQSGEHNPTILTLLDMAERCGYEVDIKFKFKK
jgi:xre family toxin-antitoxin system, antitoxin component